MKEYETDTKKIALICFILLLLILLSIPLTSFWGSANLGICDVLNVYSFKLFGSSEISVEKGIINIVWELRLPRAVLAICIGGGLAICGVVMQALTGNAMAEPYTLGVASGSSFFAALSIAAFANLGWLSDLGTSASAFIGACLAMSLVYAIATDQYGVSPTKLILTGIGVSMICSALTQLVISLVGKEYKVKGIVYWSMGSLAGARWDNIIIPFITLLIGGFLLYLFSEQINLLAMGKDTATVLGTDVGRLQKILILIISAITGVMVAFAGTIGFIGLIIPHTVRFFVGADNRKVLPVSLFSGALFTMWIDSFARVILAPQELPIGVLTALLGGPFFLTLLKKNRR